MENIDEWINTKIDINTESGKIIERSVECSFNKSMIRQQIMHLIPNPTKKVAHADYDQCFKDIPSGSGIAVWGGITGLCLNSWLARLGARNLGFQPENSLV